MCDVVSLSPLVVNYLCPFKLKVFKLQITFLVPTFSIMRCPGFILYARLILIWFRSQKRSNKAQQLHRIFKRTYTTVVKILLKRDQKGFVYRSHLLNKLATNKAIFFLITSEPWQLDFVMHSCSILGLISSVVSVFFFGVIHVSELVWTPYPLQ